MTITLFTRALNLTLFLYLTDTSASQSLACAATVLLVPIEWQSAPQNSPASNVVKGITRSYMEATPKTRPTIWRTGSIATTDHRRLMKMTLFRCILLKPEELSCRQLQKSK
ncbi:hypothetical protein TKK_0015651 [Trichogramma kaykai]